MTTTTTTCPSWCTADHAEDERRGREEAAAFGLSFPEADAVPIHTDDGLMLGDVNDVSTVRHGWCFVQLVQNPPGKSPEDSETRICVLDQEMTLGVAAELAAALPVFIARARQDSPHVSQQA